MSGERDTSAQSQITTDSDTIRSWGETHELVPVRHEVEGEERIDVARESDKPADAEELSWDEFERELSEGNRLVVRRGTGETAEISVFDRSEVLGYATSDEDVEEALLEGKTVETEFTETKVVEHTVVEEVTVESQLVDTEAIQSTVVDAELLTSEVDHCTVSRVEDLEESAETIERLRPGMSSEETYDVEIGVNEGWDVTREVVERLTIESRVVRTDVEDTETVESDTIREEVDIEGVTQTVLEGELVASPEAAESAVQEGRVETSFREDDVMETHLIRRQTIDEEMSVTKEITGQVSDAETLTADTITHTVVESDIVEEDEYDYDLTTVEIDRETDVETTETETEAGVVETETETATAETETGMTETETEAGVADTETEAGVADTETEAGMTDTETEVGMTDTETETAVETEAVETDVEAGEAVMPTEDDEGKRVVNPSGDEIGMVVDVEGGRMYVDPHPSITDRIRTALGWGDHDDDTYPVENDHISRIEDDEVVLGVERRE